VAEEVEGLYLLELQNQQVLKLELLVEDHLEGLVWQQM
jgi:hypothetical protein